MKNQGFALLPLIIILVIVIGIGIVVIQNQLWSNQNNNTVTPQAENTEPNILTQDHEFINKKYNYSLKYSDIYDITTLNPSGSETVNFKRKDDQISAMSGISIKVIESDSRLRDICGTEFLENEGILCNKDDFRFYPLLGNLPWETYEKDLIGVVPTGYVYASLFSDNYIYLVINYSYEESEAGIFVSNFRFINWSVTILPIPLLQ